METTIKTTVTMPQWAIGYFKSLRCDSFRFAAGVDGIVRCYGWRSKETRNPEVYSARWHQEGVEPFSGFAFGAARLDLAKAIGTVEVGDDAPQSVASMMDSHCRHDAAHIRRTEVIRHDSELLGILSESLDFADDPQRLNRWRTDSVAIVPAMGRGDAHYIVATDGRRMSVRSVGCDCRERVDRPDMAGTVLLDGRFLRSAIQSIGKKNWKHVVRVTITTDTDRSEPIYRLDILMADGELRSFLPPGQLGRFPSWDGIWAEAVDTMSRGTMAEWPDDAAIATAKASAAILAAKNKTAIAEAVKQSRGRSKRIDPKTEVAIPKVYLADSPFDFGVIEPLRAGTLADSMLRVEISGGIAKLVAESRHCPRIAVAMGLSDKGEG